MLMSGYLTDKSISGPEYYNLAKFEYSKLDQLLSTLCSLKKIDLDYADIYLDYDYNYSQYKHIVKKFIVDNFQNTSLRFFPFRLEYFSQWVTAAEMIPREATSLLLMNNLDHVFVPEKNLDYKEFVNFVTSKNSRSIGCILHWQEFITGIGVKKFGSLESGEPVFYNQTCRAYGTTLTTPGFFKSWWQSDFTGGNRIVRPDNPFGPGVEFDWVNQYIPAREFFRHLDGYGHNGIRSPQAAPLRPCCQYLDDNIVHTDWLRGYRLNSNADLPLEKPRNLKIFSNKNASVGDFKDYLINANSAYFKLFRSIQLLQPKSPYSYARSFFLVISLLKYDYMRKSLYKFLFTFNSHKFRVKYILAIKYMKFQSKNISFPKHISELLELRYSKIFRLIINSLSSKFFKIRNKS
jgi:hypothetical protein